MTGLTVEVMAHLLLLVSANLIIGYLFDNRLFGCFKAYQDGYLNCRLYIYTRIYTCIYTHDIGHLLGEILPQSAS